MPVAATRTNDNGEQMSMEASIALISGEVSGDIVGAALVEQIKSQGGGIQLWGIGSRRMAAAGVDLLYDSGDWSAIGYIEAIKLYPTLRFKMYPHVIRELDKRRPNVAILIDFGAFNMKVARWCAAKGIKVLYYFPPGSWRKTGKSGEELARVCTQIATPFPWSAERLKQFGANVEFVGHPLLEIARPTMSREQFADVFGLDADLPIIGLLPGSRGFEVEHNTHAMFGAARLINRDLHGAQFVVASASPGIRKKVETQLVEEMERAEETAGNGKGHQAVPDGDEAVAESRLVTPEGVVVAGDLSHVSDFEARLRRQVNPLPVAIAEGRQYDVMAHADVLIVCSGTATLEAAIVGTPMVIIYRGSRLMELEYKLRMINRLEHIGLPNIIAGKRIVPELIQHDATPEALAHHALEFLKNPAVRAQAKADLKSVRDTLGEPGASRRVAEMALQLAGIVT